MVSISLNNLDKNLDTAKSHLKSLEVKNLDQEKKISVGLNTKDILDLDLDWSRLLRPPGLLNGNSQLRKCQLRK